MSASIGEPGHETSGWTHAICDACWESLKAPQMPEREPVRVRASDEHGHIHPTDYHSEACCYCGQPTRGIYVRERATAVHSGAPS